MIYNSGFIAQGKSMSGSCRGSEGEPQLDVDMSATEVDCSEEESDIETIDGPLKLCNSINPVDFRTELVFSEAHSSEGVDEMARISSARRRTSSSVQEDKTRRHNAIEDHNRRERIRWENSKGVLCGCFLLRGALLMKFTPISLSTLPRGEKLLRAGLYRISIIPFLQGKWEVSSSLVYTRACM